MSLISLVLWYAAITTVINGHNHEVVIIVDNSLSLTSSECIQQQTAISGLFKEYKNVSNDMSYISFSHYKSEFIQLISFDDIQNDTKSIETLASKIKTFDCNKHVDTNNYYNNSFNQLLNVFKYAISTYKNETKTKRILLFNNFETTTRSQEEVCKYFTKNNKTNLIAHTKTDIPFGNIRGIVSVNIMGHGVNNNYLACDKKYKKRAITLNNSSFTTFNAYHDEIFYAICTGSNDTCETCLTSCAAGNSCPSWVMDKCDIFIRCSEEGAAGGPVCCGEGIMDQCCEESSDSQIICTPTEPDDFCPADSSDSSDSTDFDFLHGNINDKMLDINGNDKINEPKLHNVQIKLDSLTIGTVWVVSGTLIFCAIFICCVCKRKTKEPHFVPEI